MQAARRELYEESGVRDAGALPGLRLPRLRFPKKQRQRHGVFSRRFAVWNPLPESEIGEVRLFRRCRKI